jgi:molybdate transport system substrate-binding protein
VNRLHLVALVSVALAAPPPAACAADEVVVFAAASLTDALAETGRDFEARSGARLVLSFGGSNDLARQIRAGAPADVFVSASVERMDEVEKAGLVRGGDRVDLLSNRLVVVVPSDSSQVMTVPEDLARARRLALADPDAVPAGIYARQWLVRAGLWAGLRERVVPTLDVRAALFAVASRAAEAGIVYRTDASLSKRVRVAFEVPADEAPRIAYVAALLASSRKPAARAFFEHLRSTGARAVFERLGFEVLGGR